jgi:hypothetical protein
LANAAVFKLRMLASEFLPIRKNGHGLNYPPHSEAHAADAGRPFMRAASLVMRSNRRAMLFTSG